LPDHDVVAAGALAVVVGALAAGGAERPEEGCPRGAATAPETGTVAPPGYCRTVVEGEVGEGGEVRFAAAKEVGPFPRLVPCRTEVVGEVGEGELEGAVVMAGGGVRVTEVALAGGVERPVPGRAAVVDGAGEAGGVRLADTGGSAPG